MPDVVEVPHHGPSTGNVICPKSNEVIVSGAENLEAAERVESMSLTLLMIDLSEFRTGAEGPTCSVLPIERK